VPLYDYECRNCGHIVEVLHGVNASGPAACEQCGGPMRKLMSTPAIVFKGSGWAKKDARDARPKATKSTASGAKNDSTDSKPSDSSSSSSESDSGAGKAAEQTKSGDGAAKQAGTKESSASAAPD
jgi:putative FmdB family regulatory protein